MLMPNERSQLKQRDSLVDVTKSIVYQDDK
jgi:hypothetical protein